MESTFERAIQMAGTQLTKMRWALGVNGVLSIALGVVILAWPGISLYALTILFGAYSLHDWRNRARRRVQRHRWGRARLARLFGLAGYRRRRDGGALTGIICAQVLLRDRDRRRTIVFGFAIFGAFSLPLDGGDTALFVPERPCRDPVRSGRDDNARG